MSFRNVLWNIQERKHLAEGDCVRQMLGTHTLCYDFEHSMSLQVK